MDTSHILTAWRGHEPFAHWLVQTMDPKIVVELGVDFGFSLIELARYNKGLTVGVDWFHGDDQTGYRNSEDTARANVADSGLEKVKIWKMSFDEAVRNFEAQLIDIVHIDGAHDYLSVKRDFVTWLPKVRHGGVILLHDTQSFPNDVGRLFHEIQMPKFEFTHSAGLGVITKL